jgi:hypothetical protein
LTLLRPDFLLEQADASGYAAEVKQDVDDTLVSYGMSSGFDPEFFEGMVSEDDIRADIFLEVEHLYEPNAPGANVEGFRDELYEKLRAYVTGQGAAITGETDAALLYLADISAEAYGKSIGIPFSAQLSSVIVKARRLVLPAAVACAIFILIVIAFLARIRERKYRTWRYIIYALSASGLFFIVMSALALNTDRFRRIGISGKGLYQLMTTYTTNLFDLVLWFGCGVVAISVVCTLLYLHYRRSSYREAR